jgi:hypothetical protein
VGGGDQRQKVLRWAVRGGGVGKTMMTISCRRGVLHVK